MIDFKSNIEKSGKYQGNHKKLKKLFFLPNIDYPNFESLHGSENKIIQGGILHANGNSQTFMLYHLRHL